jgi:excisionase family DNA binding protein
MNPPTLVPLPTRPDAAKAPERARPATVIPIQESRAVYSVKETAYQLSLSLGSTYKLIRSGEIPAIKLGGRWVVPKKRLHTWIDNLPTATTTEIDREFARLDREEHRRDPKGDAS